MPKTPLLLLLACGSLHVTLVNGINNQASALHDDRMRHFMARSWHERAPTFTNATTASGAVKAASSWAAWLRSIASQGRTHIDTFLDIDALLGISDTMPESQEVTLTLPPPAAGPKDAVPASRKQMYFRPVSVTLRVVMLLTIVSLTGYTWLSIGRNTDELSATFRPSMFTQVLTVAARVGTFTPMLCMLCVACRMYILATTEGLGEPPQWVKTCMWAAAGGVLIQLLMVLVLPAFVVQKMRGEEEAKYDMTEGKSALAQVKRPKAASDEGVAEPETQVAVEDDEPLLDDLAGENNDVIPDINKQKFSFPWALPVFWILQASGLLLLYGGICGIVVGILTFPAQSTKISPAVLCTILLAVVYFMVCFLLFIGRIISGTNDHRSPVLNSALAMSSAARKAPMFAIVFLASRMRALNLDPPYGMPPKWMQALFFTITACMYLEVICAAVIGATAVEQTKGYYGVYLFKCQSKTTHIAMHCIALVSYFAMIPIAMGVYMMKDAHGQEAPLSTTLRCVLTFAAVYFSVMLLQTSVFLSIDTQDDDKKKKKKQKENPERLLEKAEKEKEEEEETNCQTILRDSAVSAGISLTLAPLLCVLFVATRMRALQITNQQGAPPGWAQDCMLISVFACCVQSFCCIVMPIFIGKATKVDEDGNPDYDLRPMVGAYAVTVVKYVALFTLHGSVIAICVAVFVMTPETAHSGARFLTNPEAFFKACMITVLIFCIALLFSTGKVVGMAIKLAIEACDKLILGVDITIKKVALNAFSGYVHVQKLVLHQPECEIKWGKVNGKMKGTKVEPEKELEWAEDYIVKIDEICVKVNIWRLAKTMGKEFELENLTFVGLQANIEKPNANLRESNSNIEYIINHLDEMGLIPPEEPADEAAKKKAAEEAKRKKEEEEKKKAEEAKKKAEEAKKKAGEPEKASAFIPTIILRKIDIGRMGAGVNIHKGVPIIGQVKFHPTIGEIKFTNIQRDIFNDRTDLAGPEIVGLLIKAICGRIFQKVVVEIPQELKRRVASNACSALSLSGTASVVKKTLSSLGCDCSTNVPKKALTKEEPAPEPIKGASPAIQPPPEVSKDPFTSHQRASSTSN